MAEQSERILFENAAYRLTASGLQQAGLTAELEGTAELRITRRLISYPDTTRTDIKTVEYGQ